MSGNEDSTRQVFHSRRPASAAQGGLAARKANGLLQKHGACLKKGNAAIASLKGQVGELKRQLQQAEKGAVRKDRQAAHADSEVARQHAKAGVALAPLQGGARPTFSPRNRNMLQI